MSVVALLHFSLQMKVNYWMHHLHWDQKRIQRIDGAKEMGVRLSDDQVEHLSIKYLTAKL